MRVIAQASNDLREFFRAAAIVVDVQTKPALFSRRAMVFASATSNVITIQPTLSNQNSKPAHARATLWSQIQREAQAEPLDYAEGLRLGFGGGRGIISEARHDNFP